MSLAHLGRFAEAAEHEAEAIRLAESTHHAFTIGLAYFAASTLHLVKGDWAKTRFVLEHGISVLRAGNVAMLVYPAVASSALVLAQFDEAGEALNRLREAERVFERQAAAGHVGFLGRSYYIMGSACLLLGRLDEALRLGKRAIEFSHRYPDFEGYAQHLLGDIATHPDRFDAENGESHYRQALALAEPRPYAPARCPLPSRPRQTSSPHRQSWAGSGAPDHRDGDVLRNGHGILAGAGGG
jgi:tetratricopeptide (TPR) repeat protein